MTVCVESPISGVHPGVQPGVQPESADPLNLLDEGARNLFRQLQWQVLHEAKTGGPPRLLCMLAYLSKMSVKEREKVMEFHHTRTASVVPAMAAVSALAPPDAQCTGFLPMPPPGIAPPQGRVVSEPMPSQAPSADEGITGLVRSCLEGSPRSCIGAAHTLGQLAGLSIESRSAIGRAGGVVALMRLASSPFPDAQAHAVSALLSLVEGCTENQTALVLAGGVAILVNIASVPGAPVEVCANIARTVGLIAKSNKAHGRVVTDVGGLPMLIRFLIEASPTVCSCAVFSLRHLALCSPDIQIAVGRAGAIPPLIRLLREGAPEVRGFAAGALASLADGCSENQASMVAAGGLSPLILMLEGDEPDACRRAAAALANIAMHSEEHRALIACAGSIPPLIRLVRDSQADAHGHGEGAYALMCIAWHSVDNQRAIVRAGGVTELVNLLREAPSSTVRGYAAGALGTIAEGNPDARAAIVQAGGIIALAALAREGGNAKACKYAVGALRHFVAPGFHGPGLEAF